MEQIAPGEKYQTRDAGAKATVIIGEGNLIGIQVLNNQGAATFVQLFDALLANVTLGSTNPDWEFSVPANTTTAFNPLPGPGLKFRTGIVVGAATAEKGGTPSAAGVQVFYAIV